MEMASSVTLDDLKRRADVKAYVARADANMDAIGYTEHGFRHADIVAERARHILQALGRDAREAELAAIAGYLHDIGNVAAREEHGQIAVMLAYSILKEMGMPPEELADVMAAVGNHEEQYGDPFGPVAAALIIADKSDVARSRVRDIHPSSTTPPSPRPSPSTATAPSSPFTSTSTRKSRPSWSTSSYSSTVW